MHPYKQSPQRNCTSRQPKSGEREAGADLGDEVMREGRNLLQAHEDDVPYVAGPASPGQCVVDLPAAQDDPPGLVSRQQP